MAKPRRFDEQPVRLGTAQKTPQADLERRAIHAAHATTRHLAYSDAVTVLSQQRGIEPYLAEFIDQYRPALLWRALGEQVADHGSFTRS